MTSIATLLELNTYQRRLALKDHSPEAKQLLAHLASLGLRQALDRAANYQEIIQQLTEEEPS